MRYERLWERLLEFLNRWAEARATTTGRIELTYRLAGGDLRTVELVLTAAEWDELVTIRHGDFDAAAAELEGQVVGLPDGHGFLVYRDYALVPSTGPSLHDHVETVRDRPDGGRWLVRDAQGRILDEHRPEADGQGHPTRS